MKIKLITICLLLFTSQVFADCYDDLKGSEFWIHKNIHGTPKVAFATFRNSSKKEILIQNWGFFAKDNKTIMAGQIVDMTVKPFGIAPYGMIDIETLNMHAKGNYFINCKYK